MHRTEEVAEVRKVSAELMLAGRADTVALLRIQEGKREGYAGLEGKARGRGNPGTKAQGWWGSPQH